MTKTTALIGLMSGTSLDGLDVAYIEFTHIDDEYAFKLVHAKTYDLPDAITHSLINIGTSTPSSVFALNQQIGVYYADCVNAFLLDYGIEKHAIAAIASHGQTVFHQPQQGYTVQLGCGSTLAYRTGIKVINNFRALDIAAGGQGAPLVPLGDRFLFNDLTEGFLNIGGFANLSFTKHETTVAYDIGPGNLPLNAYAQKLGFAYDENGALSRSGQVNEALLFVLNELDYYKASAPKSLGTEWLVDQFYPLIPKDLENGTVLTTLCEHIAQTIAKEIEQHALKSVYVTGGGAHNLDLLERMQKHTRCQWVIPAREIVDFKEAIIFAFLGLRFLESKHNCLSTVTGAHENVCGGSLHLPR